MKTRYVLLLAGALVFALDWYIQAPDSRSRELTAAIEHQASPLLRDYPYPFRVLRVEGNVAVMGTPRNVEVPAARFLGALHPEVNTRDASNPAFIALQEELGKVQSEARAIVLAQPGIKDVRWELDRKWLGAHQVELPPAG